MNPPSNVPVWNSILQSPDLLSRILDTADDAIISIDTSQRVLVFNQGAEKIFGYTAEEVVGQPLDILLPERFRGAHGRHVEGFSQTATPARVMAERSEIFGRRKDGEEFPAEASISKVKIDDELILTVIFRDVSKRKANENRLRQTLREREVLLREIHHRVKNNLQVVSSLLSLQARSVSEQSVRRALEESQDRVQSMALIHEQLYQSKNFADVDFRHYVQQLTTSLIRSYQLGNRHIKLETEVGDVNLSVDLALPCGLIINELVSNSLKYAFPEEQAGTVRVAVDRMPDCSVILTVEDNGVGLPPSVGFWNTKTLGLRLVRTLVRQLDGEVEIAGPPGAEFRIRFSPDSARRET